MMIHLQDLAKQGQQSQTITISERLPHFITAPCDLAISYQVEAEEDFYLVRMQVTGPLQIQCQRCLDEFHYTYENNTIVAVCRDDDRAEAILDRYECIVSPRLQVSLEELLSDELHLYAPQFHPQISDCSSEINQYLAGNIEQN